MVDQQGTNTLKTTATGFEEWAVFDSITIELTIPEDVPATGITVEVA